MLKIGKLLLDGKEYVCLVRDMSENGFRFRLFHEFPDVTRLELMLPDSSDGLAFRIAWTNEDEHGAEFNKPRSASDYLDKQENAGGSRVNFAHRPEILIVAGRREVSANLRNVDQTSAEFDTHARIELGHAMTLILPGLGEIHSRISKHTKQRHWVDFTGFIELKAFAKMVRELNNE